MFERLLDEVERRQKQLTVYATGETDVADQFATRNVTLTHRPIGPDAPGPFLAIHEHGDFCGALALEDLQRLTEPPVVHPGSVDDVSTGYRALFELLSETVFTTLDRRQLLAASRELEDRALRVGQGTLRVGFQRLSVFETQLDLYRRLASTTALDVHIYGRDDWTPPDLPGVTYHPGDDEIGRHWFLAFDGGGDDAQACSLLARSHDGHYTGFWTYDPELTAEMLAELTTLEE